ncbi:ABC transporter ATP-binding protein [[Clostridium] scindens]|uniref:ABC transporter ATP-binding protein n=1 Tax=Clostridium scindens (strain JCM 10418 / VPI 12708) TaxID=29347 RepID=UPI001D085645|nr:ABC transporter ATP-binding protein [[Clostridium] scindens]MCB6644504.1 ABC transporter ATP-binding protein [[Clostridium] scindens]
MFKLRDVKVCYERKAALRNINLTFERGRITVLLGPNGCGKSTLLKVAAGQVRPSQGCVTVDDRALEGMKPEEIAKKVAFLPQSHAAPNISAGKLVLHGRFPYLRFPRRYTAADEKIAEESMEQIRISSLASFNMQELSGGEKQKVYIAMALCQQTDAVFLDEPTTYLDIDCQVMLWNLARQLCDLGKAVVIVTHDITEAMRMADHLVVMKEGCICREGPPEDVRGSLEEVFRVKIKKIEDYYIVDI